VDLDAVAVVPDLVQPIAFWSLGFQGRECGLMNPGISAETDADARVTTRRLTITS
jgi:hypothetical protein